MTHNSVVEKKGLKKREEEGHQKDYLQWKSKGESWKGSEIKKVVLWHITTFFSTPPTIIIAQSTVFYIFSPNVAISFTQNI